MSDFKNKTPSTTALPTTATITPTSKNYSFMQVNSAVIGTDYVFSVMSEGEWKTDPQIKELSKKLGFDIEKKSLKYLEYLGSCGWEIYQASNISENTTKGTYYYLRREK